MPRRRTAGGILESELVSLLRPRPQSIALMAEEKKQKKIDTLRTPAALLTETKNAGARKRWRDEAKQD
jgi:hypothetical protein